jgi:hypothetical protein
VHDPGGQVGAPVAAQHAKAGVRGRAPLAHVQHIQADDQPACELFLHPQPRAQRAPGLPPGAGIDPLAKGGGAQHQVGAQRMRVGQRNAPARAVAGGLHRVAPAVCLGAQLHLAARACALRPGCNQPGGLAIGGVADPPVLRGQPQAPAGAAARLALEAEFGAGSDIVQRRAFEQPRFNRGTQPQAQPRRDARQQRAADAQMQPRGRRGACARGQCPGETAPVHRGRAGLLAGVRFGHDGKAQPAFERPRAIQPVQQPVQCLAVLRCQSGCPACLHQVKARPVAAALVQQRHGQPDAQHRIGGVGRHGLIKRADRRLGLGGGGCGGRGLRRDQPGGQHQKGGHKGSGGPHQADRPGTAHRGQGRAADLHGGHWRSMNQSPPTVYPVVAPGWNHCPTAAP